MGSTTSPVSVPTFNGTSTFSSSFQQVLTQAVQRASLPMQQMQNTVNDLSNQQSALTQLQTTFQSLYSALDSIGAATSGTPSASVSDPSVVSASTTSDALPGTYSIQVDTLGSYSTALSQAGSPTVTDPSVQNISSAQSFTLSVDGVNTTISPSGTSLDDLVSSINASSAGVQATIVNMGSNSSPDYRLVLTGDKLAADTIQLSDGTNDLLSTVSTGAPATYSVNGSTNVLQSDSSQVTLSPGLTVNLLSTGSQPVTVTVTTDYTSLASALNNFASDYNSAVNGIDAQIGQNAGALSGQNIIYSLRDALQSISQYTTTSGGVSSLSALGLSVDKNGQMSFDSTTFGALSAAQVKQFIGTATSGGFLETASNGLQTVANTNTGEIETEYSALQSQITQQNQLIADEQTRINDLTTNLESQLSQADAAIATLQSQKTYYTDLFQAEYAATNGSQG